MNTSDKSAAVEILGLNGFDRNDLSRSIPNDLIAFRSDQGDEDQHKELGTVTAVVTISVVAVTGLVIWASKKRRRIRIRTVTETYQDGSRAFIQELDLSESESSADVIEAIGKALSLEHAFVSAVQESLNDNP